VGGARLAIKLDREVPRGTELAVDAADLPPTDPDSFYVFQLVGLEAVDEDGASLGRVVEVHPGAANDNVELDDGRLVPLIEDAIRDVDLDEGRLVVARGFL
jgi:16S rRNA processing protein RimM